MWPFRKKKDPKQAIDALADALGSAVVDFRFQREGGNPRCLHECVRKCLRLMLNREPTEREVEQAASYIPF